MEPKLTILFVLIATIIGFSNLRGQHLARMKQIVVRPDWRQFARRRPTR